MWTTTCSCTVGYGHLPNMTREYQATNQNWKKCRRNEREGGAERRDATRCVGNFRRRTQRAWLSEAASGLLGVAAGCPRSFTDTACRGCFCPCCCHSVWGYKWFCSLGVSADDGGEDYQINCSSIPDVSSRTACERMNTPESATSTWHEWPDARSLGASIATDYRSI